ncbi:hypothetical protein Zmor_005523 [Zophobas morio]|uniref:Uncharacterized protein n=1 Tax=Zophobas morio TaxID=2755281 RepID=A0AA38IW36_9CUCU|nr:hypothetical protein Zmor_005523 [Zophobas morio]
MKCAYLSSRLFHNSNVNIRYQLPHPDPEKYTLSSRNRIYSAVSQPQTFDAGFKYPLFCSIRRNGGARRHRPPSAQASAGSGEEDALTGCDSQRKRLQVTFPTLDLRL